MQQGRISIFYKASKQPGSLLLPMPNNNENGCKKPARGTKH